MRRKTLVLSLCTTALSGCWWGSDRAQILVATVPPDAACVLSRSGQPIGTAEPTPAIAIVSRVTADIVVQCRRPGFQEATAVLSAQAAGGGPDNSLYSRPPHDYEARIEIVMTPSAPLTVR